MNKYFSVIIDIWFQPLIFLVGIRHTWRDSTFTHGGKICHHIQLQFTPNQVCFFSWLSSCFHQSIWFSYYVLLNWLLCSTRKIDRYWYQWFAVTLVRPTGCRRPQRMAFVGRCDPQLCSVMNHWQLDRVETLASLRKDSFPRLEAPPSSVTEIQRHRFQLQLSAGPATPATWCIPGAVDWKWKVHPQHPLQQIFSLVHPQENILTYSNC